MEPRPWPSTSAALSTCRYKTSPSHHPLDTVILFIPFSIPIHPSLPLCSFVAFTPGFGKGFIIPFFCNSSLSPQSSVALACQLLRIMHHKKIAFGLLAALASLASAEDKSDVHELTKKTFDDFVKANPLVLAECELLACYTP